MAITDKLNTAWQTNKEQDLLFEFRALVGQGGGFYGQIEEVLAKIAELQADSNFANIDAEIKTEAVNIRNAIQACKTALDEYLDFINWNQP